MVGTVALNLGLIDPKVPPHQGKARGIKGLKEGLRVFRVIGIV